MKLNKTGFDIRRINNYFYYDLCIVISRRGMFGDLIKWLDEWCADLDGGIGHIDKIHY